MATPTKFWESIDRVPQVFRDAYAAQRYSFEPPLVPTTYWDELSWLNYIAQHGYLFDQHGRNLFELSQT